MQGLDKKVNHGWYFGLFSLITVNCGLFKKDYREFEQSKATTAYVVFKKKIYSHSPVSPKREVPSHQKYHFSQVGEASHARCSFFASFSRKQRDCTDHLQYAGTSIPDLVEFARHEENYIASADLTLAFGLKNAFPLEDIDLVLFPVVVE
jgi:hypothetical protein